VPSTPQRNRYNPGMLTGTRSSIVYRTLRSAVAWVFLADHPILRAVFCAALIALAWLNRLGMFCVLLALGHLAQAIKELCPKEGD